MSAQCFSIPPHEQNARVQVAIANRELVLGMTFAEVARAWGEPDDKPMRGIREQWLYRDKCAYVYFRDGKLTSWQQPKKI